MLPHELGQMPIYARSRLSGMCRIGFSRKQDLAAMLGHRNAEKIIERTEREEASQNKKLDYDYDNMERTFPQDAIPMLKRISANQPHLELFYTTGESYWEFKGDRHDVEEVGIYRLKAPDGYCFDYELGEMDDTYGGQFKTAHVKFVMQRDTKKQGNGPRMQRHVIECSSLLFAEGVSYVWGFCARMNQFDVRNTRHGKNWRAARIRIKDAHGQMSGSIIRLLAFYLRNGWIEIGNKENDKLIAYLSPNAIRYLVAKGGNKTLEQFKYSRNYEKIISNYKI